MKNLARILFSCLLLLWAQPGVSETTETTYYIPDASGSPIAAMDEAGNIKWRKHYRPFGEEIEQDEASKDNRIGYTGHVHDRSTGLTYMGARYYDPAIGRFMSMDPAPVNPNDPRTWNRYAYANNNPYRYVDPDGRNAADAARLFIAYDAATPELSDAAWPKWAVYGVVLGGIALFNENGNDASDASGESGTCSACGNKTEDKPQKIAEDTDQSDKDVREKIHEAKKNIPKSSPVKNPDVEVCTTCGEIFPKAPGNRLGDSIGNIFD